MEPEVKYQQSILKKMPKYLICLKTQATCSEDNNESIKPCQELIHIQASCFLTEENKFLSPEKRFITHVKPTINPKLTPFCMQKTGITRQMIKNSPPIDKALEELFKWMKETCFIDIDECIKLGVNLYTFVIWGNWDLKNCLFKELKCKKKKIPEAFHSYINLKRIFKMIYGHHKDQQKYPLLETAIKLGISVEIAEKASKIELLETVSLSIFSHKQYRYNPKQVTILLEIPNITITPQIQYLLVLDFEATCQDNVKLNPCSQIIQFPIIVVDLKQNKIAYDQIFHHYIAPRFNPILTKFCTQLTGITQQMVTDKKTIQLVLQQLDDWIESKDYLHANNWCFVTCGDWDLAMCLKNQAKHKNFEIRDYLKRYINVKSAFMSVFEDKKGGTGMMGMLKDLKIPHQGKHHSGIDDVKNICAICVGLTMRGFSFTRNFVKTVK